MTTLVLVHGAFHGGWCFDRLIPELDARGIPSRVVDLPFTSAAEDEAATVAVVDELVASGEPVVLLGHSFGGVVISGAAAVDADAGRPGVAHLVYLTALLLSDEPEMPTGSSPVWPPSTSTGTSPLLIRRVPPAPSTIAVHLRTRPGPRRGSGR